MAQLCHLPNLQKLNNRQTKRKDSCLRNLTFLKKCPEQQYQKPDFWQKKSHSALFRFIFQHYCYEI